MASCCYLVRYIFRDFYDSRTFLVGLLLTGPVGYQQTQSYQTPPIQGFDPIKEDPDMSDLDLLVGHVCHFLISLFQRVFAVEVVQYQIVYI